jgi:hypothetical protein
VDNEFNADHLTDLAAALTYYGVLAIFPMLVVIVSLLRLLGNSATSRAFAGSPPEACWRSPVDRGLGGVRVLRRQLLLVQQDLRRDRLGRGIPRVAVRAQPRT